MSEMKKSNRGGVRPGAGRKPSFTRDKEGNLTNTYIPKINPLKELEGLYKELKKVNTKDELVIVQAKIDLLNKMLPYVEMKKPTASLDEGNNQATTITIKDVKTEGNEDGDIV